VISLDDDRNMEGLIEKYKSASGEADPNGVELNQSQALIYCFILSPRSTSVNLFI
jgi:hypothetical protein